MAKLTPFAGLFQLEPNDPISLAEYEFYTNDEVIDNYLNAFVTHRHDGHQAVQQFASAAGLVPASTGGSLDPGVTWFVGITAIDEFGGETIAATASTTTAGTATAPTIAPIAVNSAASGTLNAGTYRYTYTRIIGSGETTPAPNANVTIGFNGAVDITVPSSPDTWRLYRAFGYGPYHKVVDVVGASTTFTDDGTLCGGCDQEPPEENTTQSASKITVTRGALPSGATSWRVYAATDAGLVSPAQWRYASGASADIASATTSIIFASEEELFTGSPPPVNRTIPGASLIYASDVIYFGQTPYLPSGNVESALDHIGSSWVRGIYGGSAASASAGWVGGPLYELFASAGINIENTLVGTKFTAGRFHGVDQELSSGATAPPTYIDARRVTLVGGPGILLASANTPGTDQYTYTLKSHTNYQLASTTQSFNEYNAYNELIVASGHTSPIGIYLTHLPQKGDTYTVKSFGSGVTMIASGGFNIEQGYSSGFASTRALGDLESFTVFWVSQASTWFIR